MKILSDYHVHSPFSHGKQTILESAKKAKEFGLSQIAISDHGFNHSLYGVKRKKLEKLKTEIAEAKAKTGIDILLGMECNIISLNGDIDLTLEEQKNFDIVLCGIHRCVKKIGKFKTLFYLPFKNFKNKRVDYYTTAVVNALNKNKIDVLTHPSRVFKVDIIKVAAACKKTGTMFELNTSSCKFTKEEFIALVNTGVTFIVNSDAHTANRVGDFKEFVKKIEGIVPKNQIFNAMHKKFVKRV